MRHKLINALMFKVGWLGVVLLGSRDLHWIAPLLVLLIVGLHLSMCKSPKIETRLILIALLIGICWESFIAGVGLVVYSHGQFTPYIAPAWIISMWALLATSLNVNLTWLRDRYYLTILFGAIGGPFAFLAGEKLGAVTFPDPSSALICLSLGWGLMMFALVSISRYLDGYNLDNQPKKNIFSREAQYEA